MIPSLKELRRLLVPALTPDSASELNPQNSTPPARSAPPAFSEFVVFRQSRSQFSSRNVCRLCREQPELSVILRPKPLKTRPREINRLSLEGWLKHDFVFFGESYLCEGCAQAEGFI